MQTMHLGFSLKYVHTLDRDSVAHDVCKVGSPKTLFPCSTNGRYQAPRALLKFPHLRPDD